MSWPISAQELPVEVEVEEVLVLLVVVDIGLVMVEGPEGLDRGRGVARVDSPGSPPAPPPIAAAAAVVPEELEVVIKVVIS